MVGEEAIKLTFCETRPTDDALAKIIATLAPQIDKETIKATEWYRGKAAPGHGVGPQPKKACNADRTTAVFTPAK